MTGGAGGRFRYVFGPVPSRRLGRSLGVDLVPHKVCSLDCVYCECGATTRWELERSEFVPTEAVLAEVDRVLGEGPHLDFVTFSGSGEPTLSSALGRVIQHLQQNFPKYPLALLTNGTLLWQPEVRREVAPVQLVKVSIDAVSEGAFLRVNRPHPDLPLSRMLDGIRTFAAEFRGRFWIEVFLVPGANDDPSHLAELARFVATLRAEKVQLNSVDRPTAEPWVNPLPPERLAQVLAVFHSEGVVAEFVGRAPKGGTHAPQPLARDLVLACLSRRPLTLADVALAAGCPPEHASTLMESLIGEGAVEAETGARGTFYFLRRPG